jgi:glycosyltransferase involved in cell wall biosynthesis
MKNTSDIFIFLSNDWDSLWAAQQKVATELSLNHRVFVFETLGFSSRKWQLGDCGRLWQRLFRLVRGGTCAQSNLKIFSPPVLPVHSSAFFDFCNSALLGFFFHKIIKNFDVKNPILWTFLPNAQVLKLREKISSSYFVYECLDDFSGYEGAPKDFLKSEAEITRAADIVFVASQKQYELKKSENPDTFLVPNCADAQHFRRALDVNTVVPRDLKELEGPILGFVSALGDCVDFELIRYVAQKRPDHSIVLIGPWLKKSQEEFPKNIHYLGKKGYEDLPAYLKGIDILLLPFRNIPYMESADPIILHDALAAGKVVVSTDFSAARLKSGEVRIGNSYEAFLQEIDEALVQQKKIILKPASKHDSKPVFQWKDRVRLQLSLIQRKKEEKETPLKAKSADEEIEKESLASLS